MLTFNICVKQGDTCTTSAPTLASTSDIQSINKLSKLANARQCNSCTWRSPCPWSSSNRRRQHGPEPCNGTNARSRTRSRARSANPSRARRGWPCTNTAPTGKGSPARRCSANGTSGRERRLVRGQRLQRVRSAEESGVVTSAGASAATGPCPSRPELAARGCDTLYSYITQMPKT